MREGVIVVRKKVDFFLSEIYINAPIVAGMLLCWNNLD